MSKNKDYFRNESSKEINHSITLILCVLILYNELAVLYRGRELVQRSKSSTGGRRRRRGSALIELRWLYCAPRDAPPLFAHFAASPPTPRPPANGSSRLATCGANFIDITTCPGSNHEWRNKTPKAPFESQICFCISISSMTFLSYYYVLEGFLRVVYV